jgi:hypothetical protein
MYQLDAVEVEEATQEVARRDAESALDMREEDDGLAGPLRRELLTRRRPTTDLRLGPQQPAVHQGLDLLLYQCGWLPDGARIRDGSLLHLPYLEAGGLGSN